MPLINDPNYKPSRAYILEDKKGLQLARRKLVIWRNTEHFRLYRWLSQTQLAKDAGTTQAIISNLENGDYNPSIDLLARIAQALGVDTSLLIREALDRELIESISYFISKLTKKPLDILKAMKLLYFTDLIALSKRNEKLSHLQYIRRNRWPFSKEIYLIDQIFQKEGEFYISKSFAKYLVLGKKEQDLLDEVIEKYGEFTGKELMKMSYESEPMTGCTVGGDEKFGEEIM